VGHSVTVDEMDHRGVLAPCSGIRISHNMSLDMSTEAERGGEDVFLRD